MPSDFPKRGEVWRHYKGTLYEIDRITYDEESGRVRVTYFAAHESEGDPEVVYGRLLDVFLGYDPETRRRRFTFVSEPRERPEPPLASKAGQAYQVLGHIIATGGIGHVPNEEMLRVLDYFGNEDRYDPDFLPWPRHRL